MNLSCDQPLLWNYTGMSHHSHCMHIAEQSTITNFLTSTRVLYDRIFLFACLQLMRYRKCVPSHVISHVCMIIFHFLNFVLVTKTRKRINQTFENVFLVMNFDVWEE